MILRARPGDDDIRSFTPLYVAGQSPDFQRWAIASSYFKVIGLFENRQNGHIPEHGIELKVWLAQPVKNELGNCLTFEVSPIAALDLRDVQEQSGKMECVLGAAGVDQRRIFLPFS